MIKKIAIISLSRGLLGEDFIKHELDIGKKRLLDYGIEVTTTKHALNGLQYLEQNPQARAQDLLDTFNDKNIDMILCAVGGNDTYRLLPYLFENDELKNAVKNNHKIFLGFSDTTMNHLMFHKVGMNTFYGQAFLPDICELELDMLAYTKAYFDELIHTGTIKEIRPSELWYEDRKSYDKTQIGVKRIGHKNSGFQLLQGSPTFSGKILGGCIETLYSIFDNSEHNDSTELCQKYNIFPTLQDWQDKILLLESSETKSPPELYRKMLDTLKTTGIFGVINGIIVGKPCDEVYSDDYKKILVEVIDKPSLPILYNVNIGHAYPHCIIPFGIPAHVDAHKQVIRF